MWEFWQSYAAKRHKSILSNKKEKTETAVPAQTTPRVASGVVNFKDLNIGPDDDGEEDEATEVPSCSYKQGGETLAPAFSNSLSIRRAPEKNKLVIILVGLPGRGKTFLCNKLKCYLNWLGHQTRHINVGSYRRLQKGQDEVQKADFFDKNNLAGVEARQRALQAALDDLLRYLETPDGQVAIFDATNTTEERRTQFRNCFHGKYQYMFIESICDDPVVLEQNYLYKMQYSPDYQGVDIQQALEDFKARIQKYEEVYEPINDRTLHYIKLIDMVTGRGYMDVNRISGYLPGKIVFFLMQVCKSGISQARKIWLTRHGESEFNLAGRIGGDSALAPSGDAYARALSGMLLDRVPVMPDDQLAPVSVWTSTLRRTIQTAQFLPFPKLRWKALDEIHAGVCDGLTYPEVEERFPDEFTARAADKLQYRYPSGESYLDVIQRLEPVIIEMEREKECICVVGHQAVLRAIIGYFTAAPLQDVPTLSVPLHTLIELRPRPDGTMELEFITPPEMTRGAAPSPSLPFAPSTFSPFAAALARENTETTAAEAGARKTRDADKDDEELKGALALAHSPSGAHHQRPAIITSSPVPGGRLPADDPEVRPSAEAANKAGQATKLSPLMTSKITSEFRDDAGSDASPSFGSFVVSPVKSLFSVAAFTRPRDDRAAEGCESLASPPPPPPPPGLHDASSSPSHPPPLPVALPSPEGRPQVRAGEGESRGVGHTVRWIGDDDRDLSHDSSRSHLGHEGPPTVPSGWISGDGRADVVVLGRVGSIKDAVAKGQVAVAVAAAAGQEVFVSEGAPCATLYSSSSTPASPALGSGAGEEANRASGGVTGLDLLAA